jgi:3',5'-nucleoside bisphosphate phosphatase
VRIDLHTHSTASDGTDPPAEVMRRARDAGLDVVALTDHDTLAGHDEARRALPPGLTLLPGMELSCRLGGVAGSGLAEGGVAGSGLAEGGRSVHMLAYAVDPGNAALAAECAAIVEARAGRARGMVDRLRELGVGITWPQVQALAGGGVVGRPHIARAMVAAGAVRRPDEAFTSEWIGAGGRAYVTRYAPDPVAAIGFIRAAGGAAVLAHPGAVSRGDRLSDQAIAGLAAAGMAGLEVAHPDHDHAERERLGALAASLGLVPCGGSDDHGSLTGHRIGCETTAPEAYERLLSRTSGGLA